MLKDIKSRVWRSQEIIMSKCYTSVFIVSTIKIFIPWMLYESCESCFLLCGTREEKSFAGSVIKRMLVFLLFVVVVVVILDIEQSKKYLYHFVAREDDNFLRFLWF